MSEAPLNKLEAWKRQGAQLRGELEAEMRTLEKRLAEIRSALKSLPSVEQPARRSEASISGLIKAAVAKHPGAKSSDVVAAVWNVRPNVNAKVIHAILYRLRVDKRIRADGKRGDMRYSLSQPSTNGREAEEQRRSSQHYKARAQEFLDKHPGHHSVAAVAKAIGLENKKPQARNILVRLRNEGVIQRVSNGVYERSRPLEEGTDNTNP